MRTTLTNDVQVDKELLTVDKLSVYFGDEEVPFRVVDRISYGVKQGEVVGIVDGSLPSGGCSGRFHVSSASSGPSPVRAVL